jgi:acyl-ACP thioesterase
MLEIHADVRLNEVGSHGSLRPTVLLDYLLDAAGNHASQLGVGMHAMFDRGLTWFLSRLHVKVLRYPRGGEEMVVRTWPSGIQRLFYTREFVVVDAAGQHLAVASSAWIVVNPETRRPVRPSVLGVVLPWKDERPLPSDFAKLAEPEGDCLLRTYRPLASDIDVNRHVNSTVYPRWTLDCVSDRLRGHCLPAEIEIAYLAETQYGDEVQGKTQIIGDRSLHSLIRLADGTELLRQTTRWQAASELLG